MKKIYSQPSVTVVSIASKATLLSGSLELNSTPQGNGSALVGQFNIDENGYEDEPNAVQEKYEVDLWER